MSRRLTEPVVLDGGHVTYEAEEAEIARGRAPVRKLLRGQVRALELEGEAMVTEIPAVRRRLTTTGGHPATGILFLGQPPARVPDRRLDAHE